MSGNLKTWTFQATEISTYKCCSTHSLLNAMLLLVPVWTRLKINCTSCLSFTTTDRLKLQMPFMFKGETARPRGLHIRETLIRVSPSRPMDIQSKGLGDGPLRSSRWSVQVSNHYLSMLESHMGIPAHVSVGHGYAVIGMHEFPFGLWCRVQYCSDPLITYTAARFCSPKLGDFELRLYPRTRELLPTLN